MRFFMRLILATIAILTLSAESCRPPCPVGQKCGQSPQQASPEKCSYKMTCFYSQESNRVQFSGVVFNAKEPFPEIRTAIKANPKGCFSFLHNIQPEVTITSQGGQFEFGVPLNAVAAHDLYKNKPDKSGQPVVISASDPSGACAPSEVMLAASVPNESSACTCKVKWP